MAEIHEGGCLCGAVRYRVVGDPIIAGVCHCNRCKRMTGSAFAMASYFNDAAVEITSGVVKTHVGRSDESNRWFRLEFCTNCGTPLTWTAELLPGGRGIAVGTFDDPNWIKPSIHGYTRSALHWMVFPPDAKTFKTTDPDWNKS